VPLGSPPARMLPLRFIEIPMLVGSVAATKLHL
jgi:hypothetical protein